MHIQSNAINIIKYHITEAFGYIYSIDVYRDFFIAVSATVFSVIIIETIILISQWNKQVKTKKIISEEVAERFKKIENLEKDEEKLWEKFGKNWVWVVRHRQWNAYISELKTLVELNYTRLKHDQYTEFIDLLNTMRVVMKYFDDDRKIANNVNYENWLEEFKEMKWLNIKIDKLNW